MQTTVFIPQVRNLTQEIREAVLEQRAGEFSPDYRKELQSRLDRLLQANHNPTLSCLIELRQEASNLGLDITSFKQNDYEREVAWRS